MDKPTHEQHGDTSDLPAGSGPGGSGPGGSGPAGAKGKRAVAAEKVDLDTFLETTSGLLAGIFGFAGLMFLFMGTLGGKKTPPDPELLKFLPVLWGAAIFSFIVRRSLDNYYLIDPRQRKILYHFQCLGHTTCSPFLDFSEILTVSATAQYRKIKGSAFFDYLVLLVDKSGKLYKFGDSVSEGRDVCNEKAERYATLIGCPSQPCPDGGQLVIRQTAKGTSFVTFESADQDLIGLGPTWEDRLPTLVIGLATVLFMSWYLYQRLS